MTRPNPEDFGLTQKQVESFDQGSRWHRWIAKKSQSYPKFLRYHQALDAHNHYLLAVREELRRQQRERQERLKIKEREEEERLRKSVSWWRKLDGRSFERETACHYRSRGYQVKETGRTGDQGVDLVLVKGAKRIIVQCKAHRHYISPSIVRDLYGTLMHHGADEAWLISTAGFLGGAKAFAKGKPIRLLTITDILRDG